MKKIMGIFAGLMSLLGSSSAKDLIHVELINAKDKSVIAVSEMPPEQLPDSFAVDTTLTIKGKQWSVVSADPMDKPSFLKTRKLKVVLSPLTFVSPQDILFSLPTISDDVGAAMGKDIPGPDIFSIHEDDWRQIEFVSAQFKAELAQELEDIRKIYKNEQQKFGFKNLHVRKRIPNPLSNASISLADLEKIVAPVEKFKGVGFSRTAGIIPASFAWKISSDAVIWGVTDEKGNIARLCFQKPARLSNSSQISEAFASLAAKHKLAFVDWIQAIQTEGDAKAFASYFEKAAGRPD